MKTSPHILIDNDIEELNNSSCPPLYETLVLRNITNFYRDGAISTEEFHHYCKRLNATIARRPRSAA